MKPNSPMGVVGIFRLPYGENGWDGFRLPLGMGSLCLGLNVSGMDYTLCQVQRQLAGHNGVAKLKTRNTIRQIGYF